MVQKSGVHQLRLVVLSVYPIICRVLAPSNRWLGSWDFWTPRDMGFPIGVESAASWLGKTWHHSDVTKDSMPLTYITYLVGGSNPSEKCE